jgi:hypothetical protein
LLSHGPRVRARAQRGRRNDGLPLDGTSTSGHEVCQTNGKDQQSVRHRRDHTAKPARQTAVPREAEEAKSKTTHSVRSKSRRQVACSSSNSCCCCCRRSSDSGRTSYFKAKSSTKKPERQMRAAGACNPCANRIELKHHLFVLPNHQQLRQRASTCDPIQADADWRRIRGPPSGSVAIRHDIDGTRRATTTGGGQTAPSAESQYSDVERAIRARPPGRARSSCSMRGRTRVWDPIRAWCRSPAGRVWPPQARPGLRRPECSRGHGTQPKGLTASRCRKASS